MCFPCAPQIFSGGRNWANSVDFAKNLVRSRGGPGLLLARSKGFKPNAVTGVSRTRLLLEIVAVYELFGNAFSFPHALCLRALRVCL